MRIKRKTLRSERQGGRLFVLLGQTQPTEQTTDRPDEPNALISQMQGRIDSLERQLSEANERDRENRRIIAGLTSRIPAIEAPQEPPEDAETVEEAPEGAEPHSAAEEARDELGAERARREMAETTLREGMDEERRRREEAERERDELRRELHAFREPRESPEPAEEQQGRGEPRPAERGAQETSESLAGRGSGTARGSLWRRLFGR
jgi:vacuolar-type H+-ATPase subunit I/STV1